MAPNTSTVKYDSEYNELKKAEAGVNMNNNAAVYEYSFELVNNKVTW
jgi:hypothetical protein